MKTSAKFVIRFLALPCLAAMLMMPGVSMASMPLGHIYAAVMVHKQQPERLKEVIKNNRNAYMLGCQGHDLAYWAPNAAVLKWVMDAGAVLRGAYNYPDRPGELFHEDGRTGRLIRAMFREIANFYKGDYPKADDYRLAFALGWISHYITDIYIHTLVERYGGVYDTPEGQNRHVQLELVESKHAAGKLKLDNVRFSPDLRSFAFLTRALTYIYPEVPAYKGKKREAIIYVGYKPYKTIEYDYAPADFVEMLDYGTMIMDDANRCLQESIVTGKGECQGWAQLGWEYKMKSRLVSERAYRGLLNPIEMELRTEADRVVGDITIHDHGLYGKFLRDWEQIMAMSIAYNTRIVRKIDQAFARLEKQKGKVDPVEFIDRELAPLFPDINILSPERRSKKDLPKELINYFERDKTTRGDPYPRTDLYCEVRADGRLVKDIPDRVKLRPPEKGEANPLDYLFHNMMGLVFPNAFGYQQEDKALQKATLEIPLKEGDPPVNEMEVKIALIDEKPLAEPLVDNKPFYEGVEFIVGKWTSEIALRLPGSVVNAFARVPYVFRVGQPAQTKPRQSLYLWRFSDGSRDAKTAEDKLSHIFNSPGQYYLAVAMYDQKTGRRLGRGGTVIIVNPSGVSQKEIDLLDEKQATLEGAYHQAIGQYPGRDLEEKFQAYAWENRQKAAASWTPTGQVDYESMIQKTLEDMKQKYRDENNGEEMSPAQLEMVEKIIRQQVGTVKTTFAPPPANLYKSDPKTGPSQ